MPPTQTHLSELLLESRLHQPADAFRSRQAFCPDMEAVHAILFNLKYDRQAKIQDHRQVWKRLALEGLVSSFVILLTSKHLITKEPNTALMEICRRLLELYRQIPVPDDTDHTEREYVFLRRPDNTLLKFSTLPNIFCAQGDGRWWHDHRTPGGITQGLGWVQRDGGPVEEVKPGDVVFFEVGEKHWHGASAQVGMVHIAITETVDGKAVDWLEPVDDAQYSK